ncbi:MAG TPA: hypothetical protein VGC92_14240, partial [Phenylobacterium sp.]
SDQSESGYRRTKTSKCTASPDICTPFPENQTYRVSFKGRLIVVIAVEMGAHIVRGRPIEATPGRD